MTAPRAGVGHGPLMIEHGLVMRRLRRELRPPSRYEGGIGAGSAHHRCCMVEAGCCRCVGSGTTSEDDPPCVHFIAKKALPRIPNNVFASLAGLMGTAADHNKKLLRTRPYC